MSESTITFQCADCERTVTIDESNPPKDDDTIRCNGCDRVFGTYAQVKEAMITLGKKHVDDVLKKAGLPGWIKWE